MLPIAEVLMATQWQIEQLAGAAGLKIIEQIIPGDARRLAGEQRYGRDGRSVLGTSARMGCLRWAEGRGRKTARDEQADRARSSTD
jgi:hypothetical protein